MNEITKKYWTGANVSDVDVHIEIYVKKYEEGTKAEYTLTTSYYKGGYRSDRENIVQNYKNWVVTKWNEKTKTTETLNIK